MVPGGKTFFLLTVRYEFHQGLVSDEQSKFCTTPPFEYPGRRDNFPRKLVLDIENPRFRLPLRTDHAAHVDRKIDLLLEIRNVVHVIDCASWHLSAVKTPSMK